MNKHPLPFGILIAGCIISLWAVSLGTLLSQDWLPLGFIPVAVVWQMFLYTGLFITAHDAMHGTIYPQSPRLNHLIGAGAVLLYGLFSYRDLLQKHWLHHRFPASDRDPDFHDAKHQHPVLWYLQFVQRYWGWKQFSGLIGLLGFASLVLHIPMQNLFLFWGLPAILSSIQLFYFGTFLPHRELDSGYQNSHRTRTTHLPVLWSFLSCYHFGYHEEHHEYPNLPWWRLPSVYWSAPNTYCSDAEIAHPPVTQKDVELSVL